MLTVIIPLPSHPPTTRQPTSPSTYYQPAYQTTNPTSSLPIPNVLATQMARLPTYQFIKITFYRGYPARTVSSDIYFRVFSARTCAEVLTHRSSHFLSSLLLSVSLFFFSFLFSSPLTSSIPFPSSSTLCYSFPPISYSLPFLLVSSIFPLLSSPLPFFLVSSIFPLLFSSTLVSRLSSPALLP